MAAAMILTVVTASPSLAQDGQTGARSFVPADFERYAPKTALDMVRQIPGFAIDEAENRRGLGQGGVVGVEQHRAPAGNSDSCITECSAWALSRSPSLFSTSMAVRN